MYSFKSQAEIFCLTDRENKLPTKDTIVFDMILVYLQGYGISREKYVKRKACFIFSLH